MNKPQLQFGVSVECAGRELASRAGDFADDWLFRLDPFPLECHHIDFDGFFRQLLSRHGPNAHHWSYFAFLFAVPITHTEASTFKSAHPRGSVDDSVYQGQSIFFVRVHARRGGAKWRSGRNGRQSLGRLGKSGPHRGALPLQNGERPRRDKHLGNAGQVVNLVRLRSGNRLLVV
jgi:hypothetical protein